MKKLISILLASASLCLSARDTNRYENAFTDSNGVTWSQRGGLSTSNYVATAFNASNLFATAALNDGSPECVAAKALVRAYVDQVTQDFRATKLTEQDRFFDNLKTNANAAYSTSFSNAVTGVAENMRYDSRKLRYLDSLLLSVASGSVAGEYGFRAAVNALQDDPSAVYSGTARLTPDGTLEEMFIPTGAQLRVVGYPKGGSTPLPYVVGVGADRKYGSPSVDSYFRMFSTLPSGVVSAASGTGCSVTEYYSRDPDYGYHIGSAVSPGSRPDRKLLELMCVVGTYGESAYGYVFGVLTNSSPSSASFAFAVSSSGGSLASDFPVGTALVVTNEGSRAASARLYREGDGVAAAADVPALALSSFTNGPDRAAFESAVSSVIPDFSTDSVTKGRWTVTGDGDVIRMDVSAAWHPPVVSYALLEDESNYWTGGNQDYTDVCNLEATWASADFEKVDSSLEFPGNYETYRFSFDLASDGITYGYVGMCRDYEAYGSGGNVLRFKFGYGNASSCPGPASASDYPTDERIYYDALRGVTMTDYANHLPSYALPKYYAISGQISTCTEEESVELDDPPYVGMAFTVTVLTNGYFTYETNYVTVGKLMVNSPSDTNLMDRTAFFDALRTNAVAESSAAFSNAVNAAVDRSVHDWAIECAGFRIDATGGIWSCSHPVTTNRYYTMTSFSGPSLTEYKQAWYGAGVGCRMYWKDGTSYPTYTGTSADTGTSVGNRSMKLERLSSGKWRFTMTGPGAVTGTVASGADGEPVAIATSTASFSFEYGYSCVTGAVWSVVAAVAKTVDLLSTNDVDSVVARDDDTDAWIVGRDVTSVGADAANSVAMTNTAVRWNKDLGYWQMKLEGTMYGESVDGWYAGAVFDGDPAGQDDNKYLTPGRSGPFEVTNSNPRAMIVTLCKSDFSGNDSHALYAVRKSEPVAIGLLGISTNGVNALIASPAVTNAGAVAAASAMTNGLQKAFVAGTGLSYEISTKTNFVLYTLSPYQGQGESIIPTTAYFSIGIGCDPAMTLHDVYTNIEMTLKFGTGKFGWTPSEYPEKVDGRGFLSDQSTVYFANATTNIVDKPCSCTLVATNAIDIATNWFSAISSKFATTDKVSALATNVVQTVNRVKDLHYDPVLEVTWTNVVSNGHIYYVTVTNTDVSAAQ